MRILDVLAPIEAANMAGDEPVLMVNADSLGVGLDGDSPVGELGRHGVTVGIERDAELTGRTQLEHPCIARQAAQAGQVPTVDCQADVVV